MFSLSYGPGIASIHRVDDTGLCLEKRHFHAIEGERVLARCPYLYSSHSLQRSYCSRISGTSSVHTLESPSIPRPRSLCEDSPLKLAHGTPVALSSRTPTQLWSPHFLIPPAISHAIHPSVTRSTVLLRKASQREQCSTNTPCFQEVGPQ
jgi:hypothetical protein